MLGLHKNLTLAREWYEKAAAAGHEAAREALAELEKKDNRK